MIKNRDEVRKALEEKFCSKCGHFEEVDGEKDCDGLFDTESECVVYAILDNLSDWDWDDEEDEEGEE